MKIKITREELGKFMDYEYARRNHPCIKCKSDKGSCTGCEEQKAWDKRMSEIGVSKEEYKGIIAECMNAFWEAQELHVEMLNMKEKADQRTSDYHRLKSMIEIEEESNA